MDENDLQMLINNHPRDDLNSLSHIAVGDVRLTHRTSIVWVTACTKLTGEILEGIKCCVMISQNFLISTTISLQICYLIHTVQLVKGFLFLIKLSFLCASVQILERVDLYYSEKNGAQI